MSEMQDQVKQDIPMIAFVACSGCAAGKKRGSAKVDAWESDPAFRYVSRVP